MNQVPGETPERRNFVPHLEELRRRIFAGLVAWTAASGLVWALAGRWFVPLLLMPLRGEVEQLVFLEPAEPFFTLLKLSLVGGFLLVLPYLLQLAWAFLHPGLYRHERALLKNILVSFAFLFLAGIVFAWFLVLPAALRVLIGIAPTGLSPFFTFSRYLDFCLMFLFAFGIVFTVPGVIIILGRAGLVKAGMLRRNRSYFILASFILAALLTPMDIFTQFLMAVPLIVLYEISLLVVSLAERKRTV